MSEPSTETANPAAGPGQPNETPAQEVETDWKAEARKWEQRAKENTAKLKEAAPKLSEYDRMVEEQKTAEQRQAEELNRWQSEAETLRARIVASRIEAIAAPDFAYPADAVGKLDPSKYLGLDGAVDEAAIKADLSALLEERPNWRRSGTDTAPASPRLPAPNPNQGAGGNPSPGDPAAQFASTLQALMNRA